MSLHKVLWVFHEQGKQKMEETIPEQQYFENPKKRGREESIDDVWTPEMDEELRTLILV